MQLQTRKKMFLLLEGLFYCFPKHFNFLGVNINKMSHALHPGWENIFFFPWKGSVGSVMGGFVSNHYPFMLTCKTYKKRHFLTYHPKEEKPAILNLSMSKRRRFYCPHLTLVPGRKHYCQKRKKHGHATLSLPQNWYNLLSSSQDRCVLCIPPAS